MFIVFNVTTVSNIYIIGSNVNGARTTGLTDSVSPNASYVILKSGVVLGAKISGVTNANTVLATTTVNTSSSQTTASLNGGTPSTASNIPSFDAGSTYIGKNANQNFTGRFMEIMIYNSLLSSQQIQNIEGYLAWKWNLQGSLPASHPYKSYSPFSITGASFTSIQQNQIISITSGTGSITFNGISKIDILVVGGGGAGGKDTGGGGGGGGVIALSNISVTSGTAYTITVGNGGTVRASYGNNGSNSVFGSYIAIGGGGGADANAANIATPTGGGSGGGGSLQPANLQGGTATQGTTNGNNGYNGGNGAYNGGSIGAGGGGGGAGGAGFPANTTNTPYGGNGGPGYSSNITGTPTRYAAGGGGGTYVTGTGQRSTGGVGGGGGGGAGQSDADRGSTNTGSGGGGGGFNNQGLPGAGGSGIIIIRYYII
jgi:hypothetical protein